MLWALDLVGAIGALWSLGIQPQCMTKRPALATAAALPVMAATKANFLTQVMCQLLPCTVQVMNQIMGYFLMSLSRLVSILPETRVVRTLIMRATLVVLLHGPRVPGDEEVLLPQAGVAGVWVGKAAVAEKLLDGWEDVDGPVERANNYHSLQCTVQMVPD